MSEYINDTGFPSVSDVISTWVDKRWFTETSRTRGSYAHDRIEADLKEDFFIDPIDPDFENYYDSFLEFKEARIREVMFCEERLVDTQLGYCGMPDLVFFDLDQMTTLTDWKTGKAKSKTWPLQLGGYSMLLKSQRNIICEKNIIVRLRNEPGKRPLVDVYCVSECERLFTNQLELFKLLGGATWKN